MESSKYEIKEVPINDYSLHMNLKILNVQKHDFGTYVCASVNALGKVEGSVRLQGKLSIALKTCGHFSLGIFHRRKLISQRNTCAKWVSVIKGGT